jgi:hypothetical protein
MPKFKPLALALASLVLHPFTSSAGQSFLEDFSGDPAAHGWSSSGSTNLFHWDGAAGNLVVTWDSREVNSYFDRPLGTILGVNDSFRLAFNLRLSDFTPGIDPAKTAGPFQISVGLISRASATGPGFVRGSGSQSPNLVEFSFFPDPGGAWQWGPSLTTVFCDATGLNWSSGGFASSGLTTGDVFHVVLNYDAMRQVMETAVLRNGEAFAVPSATLFSTNFTDFHVDAFAVCSYNDAGQEPGYEGSILAHGTLDDVELTLPDPPVASIRGEPQAGHWRVALRSQTNWVYELETTQDFASWQRVSVLTAGTGGVLSLADTNGLGGRAFYRVLAERP